MKPWIALVLLEFYFVFNWLYMISMLPFYSNCFLSCWFYMKIFDSTEIGSWNKREKIITIRLICFWKRKSRIDFPDKIKLSNISEENKTYWLTRLKKSEAYLGPYQTSLLQNELTAKSCLIFAQKRSIVDNLRILNTPLLTLDKRCTQSRYKFTFSLLPYTLHTHLIFCRWF